MLGLNNIMKLLKNVKSVSVLPVIFALLMSSPGAALAQAGGGKGAPGLNSAMPKLFGSNTNFIAKVDARVYDKNHQETTSMPMGFEMLGDRIRVEINMTQVKSREMSPDFANQMKQMGMDQMTTILLPDKKVVLTIYPGLKSYAETPMDKDEVESSKKGLKVTKTHLGKETIDGHACEKEEVTLTDDKGTQQHATIWEAADMNKFPIQMQLTQDDASVVMKYKDVRLGRPADNHFQAPTGMAKFDNVNALMSDAITKRMNAGAAPGAAK
jgi:hypothetical protein